jgi:hypothetical protein
LASDCENRISSLLLLSAFGGGVKVVRARASTRV